MASGGLLEFTRVVLQRLSKPISGAICNYTKSHPKMRSVCVKTGNYLNYYYVRFTHYDSINLRNNKNKLTIKRLSKKKAAELGAEMIAESLLTMIPITFLIIALRRKYKEDQKLKMIDTNINELTHKYDNLYQIINTMQVELMKLNDQMIQEREGMEKTQGMGNTDLISEKLENNTASATEKQILEKVEMPTDTNIISLSEASTVLQNQLIAETQ